MKFRKFRKGAVKAVDSEELERWVPVTDTGKQVSSGEISDIDDILLTGKPILEYQIIDKLMPDLDADMVELRSTQRVTDNGRKNSYRAVVLVGDKKSHVGVGVGKHVEVKPAIERATKNAKRNMLKVRSGAGSWEDSKEHKNSIPFQVVGKSGSVKVTLKPAPRGSGIVANKVIRNILTFAGIKDVRSKSMGKTSNTYNLAMATIDALKNIEKFKNEN
ncbi:30S ribosomal protein S5 [Candidatus Micrarchaeota archaeon]|nr:30S ribosomal protein S5 [Candidatus Micrarchaeota archaeon]